MFGKIKFTYNPPKTLPTAPAPRPIPVSAAPESRAGRLIKRLNDLRDTSKYLEDLIIDRTRGIGVLVDPDLDPELAVALSRVYGSDPPPAISIEMLNHLLNADVNIMRVELAADEVNSPYIVDPIQKADLNLITNRVEDALIESGEFLHQLPVTLRQLKGDRVIFDQISDGLGQYPILQGFQTGDESNTDAWVEIDPEDTSTEDPSTWTSTPIDRGSTDPFTEYDILGDQKDDKRALQIIDQVVRTRTDDVYYYEEPEPEPLPQEIDVNEDTYENLDEPLNAWEQVYAQSFKLASEVDAVSQDISRYAEQYFYKYLRELRYVLTMLRTLKALFHKPTLKDLKATLAAVIFPKLISECSLMNFMMDRLIQQATSPARRVIDSFGNLFAQIQRIGTDMNYILFDGGLTGMVKTGLGIEGAQMPERQRVEVLDQAPKALAVLSAKIGWAIQEAENSAVKIETNMFRVLDRKLDQDGQRNEILESLQALDGLTSRIQLYMNQRPTSPIQTSIQDVLNKTAPFDEAVASINIPTPPPNVAASLNRGGANIEVPSA